MATLIARLGLDSLSKEDRLALADELWESVGESVSDFPLTPEQDAELDRRIAEADANPSAAVSWEDVWKEVQTLLGKS